MAGEKFGLPPLKGEVEKVDNFNYQLLPEGSGLADIVQFHEKFKICSFIV